MQKILRRFSKIFVVSLAFFAATSALADSAGRLVSVQNLPTLSAEDVRDLRLRYRLNFVDGRADSVLSVRRMKFTYTTTDLSGNIIEATGLVLAPLADRRYPLVSYQHGTLVERAIAPSTGEGLEGNIMAANLASRGFVVAMADYLGLGEDNFPFHPYHHALSEATASADLLRAVKGAGRRLNAELTNQLFLAGYSQGGHATVALQGLLEGERRGEFQIAASAPMAGPYDLDAIFRKVIDEPVEHSATEIAYLTYAMSRIYPSIGPLSDIFTHTVAAKVGALFDGEHSWTEVQPALPEHPRQLFKAVFLRDFLARPAHPLRIALRQNSAPPTLRLNAPTRVIYGDIDREVPFEISREFVRRLKANGSPNVEAVAIAGDHSSAVQMSMLYVADWFLRLRHP